MRELAAARSRRWSIHAGFYPWAVRDDDHSAAVGLMVGTPRRAVVVLVGFGWDDEMPFQPWPQVATTGRPGFCISMLGLFCQVRWSRRRHRE